MIGGWKARYVSPVLQSGAHCCYRAIGFVSLPFVPVKHTIKCMALTEIAGYRDPLTVQLIYLADEFIDCERSLQNGRVTTYRCKSKQ